MIEREFFFLEGRRDYLKEEKTSWKDWKVVGKRGLTTTMKMKRRRRRRRRRRR
jgi:hypothetical protein